MGSMMRGKWILIGGAVAFVVIDVAGFVYYKRHAVAPKPVQTQTPQLPRGAEITLSVRLRALNVVHVDTPMDGTIEEISVQVGDEVSEGQILGRITNTTLVENEKEAQSELDRAESRLTTLQGEMTAARLEESRLSADIVRARLEAQHASQVYERQSTLHREGATPRLVFEKSEREQKAAQTEFQRVQSLASVNSERTAGLRREIEQATKVVAEKQQVHENAQAELAAAHLVAPVSGLVTGIAKNVGDQVQRNTGALFDIATDLTQLAADADAPQAYTSRLAAGQDALLVMAELPGSGLPVVLKTVEPGRVVVEFETPTPLVRSGMTGVLRLRLDGGAKAAPAPGPVK